MHRIALWIACGVVVLAPVTGAAQTVLTISPACPELAMSGADRGKMEPIVLRYDPAAKGAALKTPKSLTVHAAGLQMSQQPRPLHDVALERQPDGTWQGSVVLSPIEAGGGYAVFDVEDEAHHIDRNGGAYWDVQLCRQGSVMALSATTKAQTYDGHLLAAGMQRAPDLAHALAIMQDDYAAQFNNFNDLFQIWWYEEKIGGSSPAVYARISTEMNSQLDLHCADSSMLQQISGLVPNWQMQLDPAVVARYRACIVALPQGQPTRYNAMGELVPVPRTPQWEAATAQNVESMLSRLDLPLARRSDKPAERAKAEEAYAAKYRDCKYCQGAAEAYAQAAMDFAEAHDLDAALRVETEWAEWDPKNPDPPGTLAQEYLKANARLDEALKLASAAVDLYAPFADKSTFQERHKSIRSQAYFTVIPYPQSAGKAEFLRSKIEAKLGQWPAALADLRAALAEMPDNKDASFALGQAAEHTGDKDAAVAAYLASASAAYQTDPDARDAYVRLYIAQHKGSAALAEATLLAAAKQHQKAIAESYVPVEIHRAFPAPHAVDVAGKPYAPPRADGKPTVLNLWSLWCGACLVELPSVLAFQKAHPETHVLALAIADDPRAVQDYLVKKHLTELHVAVVATMPLDLGTYPSTAVITPSGEMVYLHEGAPADLAAVLGKDLETLGPVAATR